MFSSCEVCVWNRRQRAVFGYGGRRPNSRGAFGEILFGAGYAVQRAEYSMSMKVNEWFHGIKIQKRPVRGQATGAVTLSSRAGELFLTVLHCR